MGMTDIHCHLLPGVDDGVVDKDEFSHVLQKYIEAGFTRIVCTPHLFNPHVETSVESIKPSFLWAKETAAAAGIELDLGAELYLGPEENVVIPFLGKFVLIECNTQVEPLYLLDRVFSMQLKGYSVILAHIERYSWFSYGTPLASRLREMGVLFQVNIEAMHTKIAHLYLEKEWIDFIATDNHGKKRAEIQLDKFKKYSKIMNRSEAILNGDLIF